MAIGDVKASGGLQTQLISGRAGDIKAQALSGLGDAVNRLAQTGMGYLNSVTDIEAVYDRRAQASQSLEIDTRLLQYQQDRAKEFTEFSRGRSSNPYGLTKDYDKQLEKQEADFLKTVPDRFREETKAKLARDRATRVGAAFVAELSLLDTADTNNLNTSLNTVGSNLKSGGVTLSDAEMFWEEAVGKTSLPAEDKAQFIERGKATLQGLEFGKLVEKSANGYGTVRDGSDGTDVVAAGLLPQQRAILNAISSREASAYNLWNGGSSFEGYEDHPAAKGKAPGESTAAGRYQFILGTWRAASASYEKATGVKVPDFSPEWQDRVALHWAEVQFNKHHSGKTFREILADGNPDELLLLRDVLGKPRSSNPNDLEWEGLGHMKDGEFIEAMTGLRGIAGGGTGPSSAPDVWTDPQFSNLTLESKMSFANAASNAAENQRSQQAAQLDLERKSFLDEAYNAGYSGQAGVLEALKESPRWDAAAQARYNAGLGVFRESEKSKSTIATTLAAGTPLASSDADALGKWFGAESFAGITQGASEAYDKMRWAVEQGRLFPKGSADAFASAIGNPQTASTALSFLASAMAGDLSILKRSGFSADTIADVQLYKNMAERAADPTKAYADYSAAKDATLKSGKTPGQLANDASEAFAESFPTAADLVDNWDGWLSFQPDTKFNEATEGQLMRDAASAYQDGYKIYGNAEGAEAYMQSHLNTLWGVTQTRKPANWSWALDGENVPNQPTRGVLMRHPPENYYPAKEQDYGYLYESISTYAESNGASRNGAVLVPDETTDQEARSGKPPTYKVLGVGPAGEAIVLPGRFGGAELEKTAKDKLALDAEATNSLGYVNEFGREATDLSAQLRTMEQKLTVVGSPLQNDVTTKLAADLAEAERKRDAAVIAAIEQGHLDPSVMGSPAEDTAASMAQTMAKRLDTDTALNQRVARMSLTDPNALQKLVEKEFKVPASLAALIVSNMQGTP